jgi:hypothetical protein
LIAMDGQRTASIGYELYGLSFPAAFHVVDSRYKIGANFDTFLKYRYSISNLDACAEGTSNHDKYRIVESRPRDTAPVAGRYRLISARSSQMLLAAEFGRYQVFKGN